MITVSPLIDSEEIKREFEKKSLNYTQNSGCVVAKCDQEVLGICLYELGQDYITVLDIDPKGDIMLVDGILRSTLHVGVQRCIFKANYSDDALTPLFEKIGFIKDKSQKILDMDKLFSDCGCKK